MHIFGRAYRRRELDKKKDKELKLSNVYEGRDLFSRHNYFAIVCKIFYCVQNETNLARLNAERMVQCLCRLNSPNFVKTWSERHR